MRNVRDLNCKLHMIVESKLNHKYIYFKYPLFIIPIMLLTKCSCLRNIGQIIQWKHYSFNSNNLPKTTEKFTNLSMQIKIHQQWVVDWSLPTLRVV